MAVRRRCVPRESIASGAGSLGFIGESTGDVIDSGTRCDPGEVIDRLDELAEASEIGSKGGISGRFRWRFQVTHFGIVGCGIVFDGNRDWGGWGSGLG
jgi:hypothetical protein